MKNIIGLFILLALSLCLGCYDDKGNYDYHDNRNFLYRHNILGINLMPAG